MSDLKTKISNAGGVPAVSNAVGVTRAFLYMMIKGQRRPSPDVAEKLARVLGVSEMELLYPGRDVGGGSGTQ